MEGRRWEASVVASSGGASGASLGRVECSSSSSGRDSTTWVSLSNLDDTLLGVNNL